MDWDAWVYGELSFPAGGVEKWKKTRPDASAWAAVPAWLRPNLDADARVSTTLANVKYWAEPLRAGVHAADCADVRTTSSGASLRAYLTGAWFAHFAGQLVAVTLAAASHGARGELVAVDLRTARGWRLRLNRAAPPRFETLDMADAPDRQLLAVAADARGWLESAAEVVLPSMTERHPTRGMVDILGSVRRDVEEPHPSFGLRDAADRTVGMPLEYPGGVEDEVARARSTCAVFDLSHGAVLRLSYNEPEAFLQEVCGRSTRQAGEVDLVDPATGAFADRALVLPIFETSRTLLGSAMDRGYLHDWLRARGAERKAKAPKVQMPVLWGGPVLAFVGPDAPSVAAGTLGDASIASMKEGDCGGGAGDAEFVVRARRHDLPAVWAWVNRARSEPVRERCRALFAGSRAEQRLDEAAGLRPRPRWTGAHEDPWTAPATVEIATEREVAVAPRPAKKAQAPRGRVRR